MSKTPATLREQILDWFERNIGAKARSGPLAKALKKDPTQVAALLAKMAEPGGELVRCRVIVSDKERGAAPREQWEYALSAGVATEPLKPYVPPKAFRRSSNPELKTATRSDAKADEAAPEKSHPDTEQNVCDGAAQVMATTAGAEVADLRAELQIAEQANSEWLAFAEEFGASNISTLREVIAAKAKRITDLDQEVTDRGLAIERYLEDIAAKAKRITDLEAQIEYQAGVIKDSASKIRTGEIPPGFGESLYAVARPRKGLQRFKTLKTAREEAEVGARVEGSAELFQLVPIGKAMRGAIWSDLAINDGAKTSRDPECCGMGSSS